MKRFFLLKKLTVLFLAVVILLTACFVTPVHATVPEDRYVSSYSAVASTKEEIHDIFPESYWEGLDALLEAHPNWKFQAFYTGLTWDECFDGTFTYLGTETVDGQTTGVSELYLSRNLIQYTETGASGTYENPTTYPTSWFSTSINGAWSWSANQWTVLSAPNWVQASEEIIKYCMDPRNFLTEEDIFQFEDQTYYSASIAEVEQVFKNVSGATLWTMPASETGIVSNNSGEDVALTYAEAVYEIGLRLNMNPVILASRIVQEQGVGTSPLISGTKTFTVTKGDDQGKTVEGGYYNYFNIEATDGTTADYELIYNSGLTEAYYGTDGDPWNTRYKALYYGAMKLKKNYVDREQKNFYFQKFNVNSSKSGCLWRQYMQSILTPQYEGKKAYQSYVGNNTVSANHLFILPVFINMPEAAAEQPTKDGNPNYKLGSIYVNGTSLDGFNTDVTEYSLRVSNETTSIRLNIHPYASSATVTVGSFSSKGDFSETLNVLIGDNTYNIVCTAENGDSRTYVLKVRRDGEVVYGDINGDQCFDSLDLAYMTAHLLGRTELTGNALEAADISGDGLIDSTDLAYLTAYMLGKITELPR